MSVPTATSKMRYVRLGDSGLKVSPFIVGCMSYGSPGWREWVKGPTESIALLKAAFDAGINTWDTANMYSNGESERVVGMALRQHNIPRSQVVIMTKAYFPVNEDDVGLLTNRPEVALLPRFVNRCGLSRVALFDAVDASLARLQTSYIDVLQIHRLDDTPFVEVMKALNDLVESGKVRYIGASSMWAHEFVQMQAIADARGWTKFISMQNEYNLLYREEEREVIRYCKKTGVGLIPWSPLAAGGLCRPASQQLGTTTCAEQNVDKLKRQSTAQADVEIINRVEEIAKKKGWTMAQVAFAWVKQGTTAPILGVSTEARLQEFVAAIDFRLTPDEKFYLEEPYETKSVHGFDQDRTTS